MTDGLEALRAELDLAQIARLIERTAQWVSPETFELLPLWFPEFARKNFLYKSNWSEPQYNTNRQTGLRVHKTEANVQAAKALNLALGIRKNEWPNWSCCHIWSVDDPKFQRTNTIISDHRFYSCVANMVLLPTPLKAFTDSMPEIQAMLRVCSMSLFSWRCDHTDVVKWNIPEKSSDEFWSAYPRSWPLASDTKVPLGVRPITSAIRKNALKRMQRIRQDLQAAGPHYPRDQVINAFEYWGIGIT